MKKKINRKGPDYRGIALKLYNEKYNSYGEGDNVTQGNTGYNFGSNVGNILSAPFKEIGNSLGSIRYDSSYEDNA